MSHPAGPKVQPQDAAALILLRPGEAEPFEVLLLRRSPRAQFMADAYVFPGGRVEAQDADLELAAWAHFGDAGARLGLSDPGRARALCVAAIRETFEEAGLLLTAHPRPEQAPALARWRARLNAGEACLREALEALDLRLDLAQLTAHDHWITPPIERRRYDTWFFTLPAPADQQAAADARETTHSAWLGPRAALDAYAAGHLQLAPPTLRQLLELAACPSLTAALTLRAGAVPQAIQPQPIWEGEILHLTLPGDPAFDPPGPRLNRISLRGGRFESVGHRPLDPPAP